MEAILNRLLQTLNRKHFAESYETLKILDACLRGGGKPFQHQLSSCSLGSSQQITPHQKKELVFLVILMLSKLAITVIVKVAFKMERPVFKDLLPT